MLTFKSTAFMASLVFCGVVICSTAFYSHSTAGGSSLLSDRQLAQIYGGRTIDCVTTDSVEGCAPEGTNAHYTPSDEAHDWTPPKKEDYLKENGKVNDYLYAQALLGAIPECKEDITTIIYAGKSATGNDKEEIEGDAGEVVCSEIWPITPIAFDEVVEDAKAEPDENGIGGNVKCVIYEDIGTHCGVCEVGDSKPGTPKKKYECPEDEGG
jgi:hypothetical protein